MNVSRLLLALSFVICALLWPAIGWWTLPLFAGFVIASLNAA